MGWLKLRGEEDVRYLVGRSDFPVVDELGYRLVSGSDEIDASKSRQGLPVFHVVFSHCRHQKAYFCADHSGC